MLNEDIAADLRAKAQRGEPGFEEHPYFVPNAESANADINKWRNARVSQNGELSVYAIADFVKGLHDYMAAVHKCAVDHGWWEEGHRNFGEMLMLMTSELAEALEAYREGDNVQQIRYEYPNGEGNERTVLYEPQFVYTDGHTELGKPVGVASELADTIIRILDVCERMQIPITEALVRKHKYNLIRPYRHGGKVC